MEVGGIGGLGLLLSNSNDMSSNPTWDIQEI